MVVAQYLEDNDVEAHLAAIRAMYKRQRDYMVGVMEAKLPAGVKFTRPEGGMFLWLTLPEGVSSMALFELALKENVAFVPGRAFYADGGADNTLRINFSNSDEARIDRGVSRLAQAIRKLLGE